jgi:hypothetical protein
LNTRIGIFKTLAVDEEKSGYKYDIRPKTNDNKFADDCQIELSSQEMPSEYTFKHVSRPLI